MIITSCPLRISLVGGSTDHPWFLNKYEKGGVISFACNLKVYITLHQDVLGYNNLNNQYVVRYTQQENYSNYTQIKNNVAREVFNYFELPPCSCTFTSDVIAEGTGLACSSSYTMALVKAAAQLKQIELSIKDICEISIKLEKIFNSLVGEQDFYGGSIGGLKRINFFKNKTAEITPLNADLLDCVDMYLLYTGFSRSSTDVLQTLDIDKSFDHLLAIENIEKALADKDINNFCQTLKQSWQIKKQSSSRILPPHIMDLDSLLYQDSDVLAHKLCGAGNGGFFLVISKKNKIPKVVSAGYSTKIYVDHQGITCTII